MIYNHTMDEKLRIGKLITEIMKSSSEISSNYCVVNGSFLKLSEVEAMGCSQYGLQSKLHMPLKLYRYYSNVPNKDDIGQMVNYSQIALKQNTVHMSSPIDFDDAYDSEISLDYSEFEKFRLIEYCRRCQIKINKDAPTQEIGNKLVELLWRYYCDHKNLDGVFWESATSEIERLSNQEFSLRVQVEFNNCNDFGVAVTYAIQKEYIEYCNKLKNTFKVACFATTPYSQLMWATYSDCHKGFCVEYTIMPNDPDYKTIYNNLFPVIYCKTRPDVTQKLSTARDQMVDEEYLWNLYLHGVLRKSFDWAYQNEWRLLLPFDNRGKSFDVRFFPITKVFLGNKMPTDNRMIIISICKEKGIPYIGVKRNPVQFEMQDCEILCENCPKYLNRNM